MMDIEVVLKPNFNSEDCYEVLGCPPSADSEKLTKAYRDLSRKYHPSNKSSDNKTSEIFVKVGEAYATLVGDDPDEESQKSAARSMTSQEAIEAFETKFGKYRRYYYSDGGILGIPYPSELREIFSQSEEYRRSMTCGSQGPLHLGFFRSWLLKSNLDLSLAIAEAVLTSGTVATCVIAFFVDSEDAEWYINVVGGVGLLLSFCLLNFWYGVTRYPVFFRDDFLSWLEGGNTRDKDIDEIRDVCSNHYHGDNKRRSQSLAVIVCSPTILVDQISSMVCIFLARLLLLPFQLTTGVSEGTLSFVLGVAESTGALVAAIGYYVAWVLGGNIVKICAVGALLVNQALYGCILFRMDFSGFLQLLVFRGFFSVSMGGNEPSSTVEKGNIGKQQANTTGNERKGGGTRDDDKSPRNKSNNERGEKEDGIFGLMVEENIKEGEESVSSAIPQQDTRDSRDLPSFHGFENDSFDPTGSKYNDFRVVPSSDTYFTAFRKAHPGSRGTKTINFAGEIYSPRIEENFSDAETDEGGDEPKESNTGSTLLAMYKSLQRKLEEGLFPPQIVENEKPQSEEFSRKGTASTKEAGQSEDDTIASWEHMTILRHMDSCTLEGERILDEEMRKNGGFLGDEYHGGTTKTESLTFVSYDDGKSAKMDMIQATTSKDMETEKTPPDSVRQQSVIKATKDSSLFPKPVPLFGGARKSSIRKMVRDEMKRETSILRVPTHVEMLGTTRSIDEEELTLVGTFGESVVSANQVEEWEGTKGDIASRRGRRPAPGKVDLPNEGLSPIAMSDSRYEPFVF